MTQKETQRLEERGATSQSHSRHKKGHMTNIYFTDSDEELMMDFVKDHEELYNKPNEQFKDKARNECLWEKFANNQKLSVKVCKSWFKSQRTPYDKFMQYKSGQEKNREVEQDSG